MNDRLRRFKGLLALGIRRQKGRVLFLVGLLAVLWAGWVLFPPLMYSSTEQPGFRKETPFRVDLLSVALAVPWLAVMYTTPVLFVVGQTAQGLVGLAVLAVLTLALWKVWWPNLPKATEET